MPGGARAPKSSARPGGGSAGPAAVRTVFAGLRAGHGPHLALSPSPEGRYSLSMNIVRRLRSSADDDDSSSGDDDASSGDGARRRDVIDFAGSSSVGKRAENQDRCAVSPRWGLVSDGVGGHAGGALAAELTVRAAVTWLGSVGEQFDERSTGEAIRLAN